MFEQGEDFLDSLLVQGVELLDEQSQPSSISSDCCEDAIRSH